MEISCILKDSGNRQKFVSILNIILDKKSIDCPNVNFGMIVSEQPLAINV